MTPLMLKLRAKGLILTIAAGNNGSNLDGNGTHNLLMHFVNKEITETVNGIRRSLRMDNMVAVAACDGNGQLADFSNYSSNTVLLAAPGVVCTSLPNTFGFKDGTSMATPQVAVTLAMMVMQFPSCTHTEIIDRLRNSVDEVSALASKTSSGGILNVSMAMSMNFFGRK